jgi:hypothetical protein
MIGNREYFPAFRRTLGIEPEGSNWLRVATIDTTQPSAMRSAGEASQ